MKYKLGEKHPKFDLYRVVALKDFGTVKQGDVGGYVESESNLSQEGGCWVSGDAWVSSNAWVYGNAEVSGDAWVYGDAEVYGNARVSGDGRVYGNAEVSGDAWVYGNGRVYGNAEVSGNAWVYGDAEVYGIARSDGYTFCYVPDKDGIMRMIAGCRYFTMNEAREHWTMTRGATALGDETLAILDCLEKLSKVKPQGCV